MSVKIRGRHVTVTSELADRIIKASERLGVTPQEVFEAALEEAMKPEHRKELEGELEKLAEGGE